MKKIFFTAVIIIAALYLMPYVNAYAAKPELTVGFSAEENSVTLNWRTDEKNVIVGSTVYKYDTVSKSYVMLARTDKTEYTDNDVYLTEGKAVRYKIAAVFEHGGKASKTVNCYTVLPDIPEGRDTYDEGIICKAYVYSGERANGSYPIIYHNYFGDIIIGKTDDYLNSFAASEDGKTVFYSAENEVYRYCVNEGKAERIFLKSEDIGEITDINVSPNGKCCTFIDEYNYYYGRDEELFVWYEQKLFHVVPNDDDMFYYVEAVCDDGRVIFSALDDNDDEEIYFYCLYEFNSKTEKYKRFAKLEYDGHYVYDTAVFPDENTYVLYNEDFGLYCGTIGSRPRLLLPAEECCPGIFASNGRSALLSDDKHIYRIDFEQGKKVEIAKTEHPMSDSDYWYDKWCYKCFKYNDDLSTVLFIDYDNGLLVRASEWDYESCTYAKRQEIPINVTVDMQIYDTSNDMNVVNLYDENNDFIAFFKNGGIKSAKNILGSDAYDRMFCYESKEKFHEDYNRYKNFMIIEPDGSTSVVYNGYFFFPQWVSGYDDKMPMTICLTKYNFDDKHNNYYESSSDVYFIDKSGKAVFGWHEGYEYVVGCG